MTLAEKRQLWRILKQVSRSFYLTLRVLPAAIRQQMGLAYLLARATDTIADTHLVSIDRRRAALGQLSAAIRAAAEGGDHTETDFGELAAAQPVPAGRGSSGERVLLESVGNALRALLTLEPSDRRSIRSVLDTITGGQDLDLIRFGSASADRIHALDTDEELDDYTFRVAGCVGEFWTKMCRAHLFPGIHWCEDLMLSQGIRFGKGLQLVNVLRDIPGDLRQGRCYIPRIRLEEAGLTPRELTDPSSIDRFRPVYDQYLGTAEDHLAAGWSYTLALPHGQIRVRLACTWPILIGLRTLVGLRTGNVLDRRRHFMIRQSEVWQLIFRSMLRYPRPTAFARLFALTK